MPVPRLPIGVTHGLGCGRQGLHLLVCHPHISCRLRCRGPQGTEQTSDGGKEWGWTQRALGQMSLLILLFAGVPTGTEKRTHPLLSTSMDQAVWPQLCSAR